MENKEELRKKSSLGVSSLVLGIISIVSVLFWYISFPSSILAIIFGKKSINRTGSKLGKAGLITGIVGISLCAFLYFTFVALILLSNL